MTLQFTWQGCDSLLAAPLVLDLVRFTDVGPAARRGRPADLPGQLLQEPLRRRRAGLRPAIPDARSLGGSVKASVRRPPRPAFRGNAVTPGTGT